MDNVTAMICKMKTQERDNYKQKMTKVTDTNHLSKVIHAYAECACAKHAAICGEHDGVVVASNDIFRSHIDALSWAGEELAVLILS